MQDKPAALRLGHIIQAIERIRIATAGMDLESFTKDWLVRSAVERFIEIISEASRHLPADLKNRHPNIPWRNVAGIGNVLRHGYEQVAPSLLWNTLRDDLPPLEKACRDELLQH